MRAIMYISEAVDKGSAVWMPHDYAALSKVSRENNVKNDITGVLSYQDGYFLHYLEGPTAKIERLIVKIAADQRHDNIQLLMNHDVACRNFSTWSMPMGSKLRKNEEFARFVKQHRFSFLRLSSGIREILNKFYMFDTDSIHLVKPQINSAEGAVKNEYQASSRSILSLFSPHKTQSASRDDNLTA